jgi:hypothetical protein
MSSPIGTLVIKTKPPHRRWCAPTEIRTPVLTLKGLRPGPLDDGGLSLRLLRGRCFYSGQDFIIPLGNGQALNKANPRSFGSLMPAGPPGCD